MRFPRPLPLACTAMLALGACGQDHDPPAPTASTAPPASSATTASSEMAWARAALDRNPALEVLAADTAAGVFTVRDRASGEIQTVRAEDLAAMPVALPSAAAAVVEPAPAAGESAATVADEAAGEPGEAPSLDYTVERSGGQVRVSGPGLSIVSAGAAATATGKADAGAKTVDPIICEGPRMMQLNDRQISVVGDAITARGGCELHITNSRIVATGVVVRDATVHITNSVIEGARASFDAGAGAKVFLQGATLKGTTRRDERAEVQEQGDNRWQ